MLYCVSGGVAQRNRHTVPDIESSIEAILFDLLHEVDVVLPLIAKEPF